MRVECFCAYSASGKVFAQIRPRTQGDVDLLSE